MHAKCMRSEKNEVEKKNTGKVPCGRSIPGASGGPDVVQVVLVA